MNLEEILNTLFPSQLNYTIDGHFIQGYAQTELGEIRLLGTVNSAPIDQKIAMQIAEQILALIATGQKTPIVFIVDTQGQALSRADELLCLNRTFAHLASCVDLLRREGHPNLALILGEAVSGGFLSYGLMANEIYALDRSEVKVMDLNAMSRVTKIAVDKLQDLSKSSAIFAPGVDNFYRMGAINAIWTELKPSLVTQALSTQQQKIEQLQTDQRRVLAEQRQGRALCNDIINRILASA